MKKKISKNLKKIREIHFKLNHFILIYLRVSNITASFVYSTKLGYLFKKFGNLLTPNFFSLTQLTLPLEYFASLFWYESLVQAHIACGRTREDVRTREQQFLLLGSAFRLEKVFKKIKVYKFSGFSIFLVMKTLEILSFEKFLNFWTPKFC